MHSLFNTLVAHAPLRHKITIRKAQALYIRLKKLVYRPFATLAKGGAA